MNRKRVPRSQRQYCLDQSHSLALSLGIPSSYHTCQFLGSLNYGHSHLSSNITALWNLCIDKYSSKAVFHTAGELIASVVKANVVILYLWGGLSRSPSGWKLPIKTKKKKNIISGLEVVSQKIHTFRLPLHGQRVANQASRIKQSQLNQFSVSK